jgi:hypothetical protein
MGRLRDDFRSRGRRSPALIILLLVPVAAAEQRIIYGPDGHISDRAVIDSGGSTTLYGPTEL